MPTRLAAETALFDRWGQLIQFVYVRCRPAIAAANGVSLPPVPILPGGTTEIYNDPIGFALQAIGVPATDPSLVVDGDLSRIPNVRYFSFLDLAEYRIIRTLVGNFTQTTESAQDRSQDWAKLADRAQARAADLEKQLAGFLSPYAFRGTSGNIRTAPLRPTYQPGNGYGRGRFGGW